MSQTFAESSPARRACLRGEPWYCFSTFNATQKMTLEDGTELTPALGTGAFVDKTLVHAGRCTPVDPEAPPTAAELLGCGVMAGVPSVGDRRQRPGPTSPRPATVVVAAGQTGAMQRVTGVVQHYAWGDPAFIPELLGVPADDRPWAELWLGTHPLGPSTLAGGRPLADVTGPLPYLLKVLAAREPLSLQTHPDARQAAAGFRRGRFGDPHPKPELLCALTPFHALCGVRPADATVDLLVELGIDGLARSVATDGPAATFGGLVRGQIDHVPAVDACRREDGTRLEAGWVRLLADRYPGDPSVAATLLLNLVVLEPGQALRLDPRNVHAYLRGAGVELMGPSDNVVRAGLTVKPVDVDQLLEVADLTPLASPLLGDSARHELPVADIALQRLDPGDRHRSVMHELAIERSRGAWYLAPGDEYAPDTTAYVVTR